ncbi:MAG TPA: hypothetical protein VM425_00745 [Myxococcota bacterium]|nr:hypothetical protein [Myxococcota bacterium]
MKKHRRLIPGLLLLLPLVLPACQAGPEGIFATPPGGGPCVNFDLNHKPLPEIPFPNDVATRADPTATTGLRINASMMAPTQLESRVRAKMDHLDGFGVMQPISVSFDAPLDIDNLLTRQRDNIDFADDALYLVDIDPHSPAFGEAVLLDMGRGNFPLEMQDSDSYFRADPRAAAGNALFETTEEDLNDNGVLDPGEDSDDDGVLDHPNVWPPGSDPLDGLMTFYESETNTLILRPVVPLRERTTYAVVLTDRLIGRLAGEPVRSPFRYVHHLSQREALERLGRIFANHQDWQLDEKNVAFAWTFTTQSLSAELVAIREGLYGIGNLGWLAEEIPVDIEPDQALNPKYEGNLPPYYILPAQTLLDVLKAIGPELLGDSMKMAEPIIDSFDAVDYFVDGSFMSPDFVRTGPDGLDPKNMENENFDIDIRTGRAKYLRRRAYFTAAVPKTTAHHKPPFPVVIYCHSYSSMRGEALGFAGFMARHGIATIGIDAWGHGIPVDQTIVDIIMSAAEGWGFEPFAEVLLEGRARDLTGNGALDSGGDYWTAYGFHIRDVVRQTVADHFQLVRVLRSLDGQRTWDLDQDDDGLDDLAGDFNSDGVVDFGGPDVHYFAWGQSGGGIHSGLLSPLEPAIIAAAPTVGGGGLADVGVRTMLGGVRRASMLRSMGPLVIGESDGDHAVRVTLIVPLATDERRLYVGRVEGVEAGDRVLVENLDRGEEYRATFHAGLNFRISMEADREDRFRVIFSNSAGGEIGRLERWPEDAWFYDTEITTKLPTYFAGEDLRTPAEGFGLARCTPGLRRMLGLFQMILDPADPGALAPNYFLRPLDIRPEGPTTTNILELTSLGDQDVPINTQAALGRAAGLIPYLPDQDEERFGLYGMTPNDWLISKHVYEGLAQRGRFPGSDLLFDPDDLDEGADGFGEPAPDAAQRLRIKIETDTGVSGIRFAHMTPTGQHGIFPTGLESGFDMFTFMVSQVAHFFASQGREISDDRCMETNSCPLPPYYK